MKRALFGSLLLGAALIGGSCTCGQDKDEAGATAQSPVLATVGDTKITADDFEAYLKFKRVAIRTEAQLDEELEKLAKREALAQAAFAGDVLDRPAIQAELDEFRRQAAQSRYFETFLRTAVTKEAVERYYNEHAADYETKRVRVAHILVRSKRNASDEERAEKRQKIDQAHAQLAEGKPFAEIAKQFSDDQVSGARGGDMGWVREGAIDARFSQTAFALEAGEHSEVIETPFGYHIIKALEGPEVRKKPLSAVEGDIRHKLRGEAKAAEVARLESLVSFEVKRGDWKPSTLKDAPERTKPGPKKAPKPEDAEAEKTPAEPAQPADAVAEKTPAEPAQPADEVADKPEAKEG